MRKLNEREKGVQVGEKLVCILIWSGGSGNHPTKNIISVARQKPEKKKIS